MSKQLHCYYKELLLFLLLTLFSYHSWSQKAPSIALEQSLHKSAKVLPGRYIVTYHKNSAVHTRARTVLDASEANRLLLEGVTTTLKKHALTQKTLLRTYSSTFKGFAIAGVDENELLALQNDQDIASVIPDMTFSINPIVQEVTAQLDRETCNTASIQYNETTITEVGLANFGSSLAVTGVASLVSTLACDPLVENSLQDKIAIIDRGTCDFTTKVYQAQLAGARGVVIVSNTDAALNTMAAGTNAALVTIPAIMISKADGEILKPLIEAGDVTITINPSGQCRPWGITRVNGGTEVSGKRAWIIDSGIDMDHPDLRINQSLSRNFVSGESSPEDLNGHGTHVAGTVGAINNNIGVIGVAPGVEVVAIRVMNAGGSGNLSDIFAGIDYVGANASSNDVANLSIGLEYYPIQEVADIIKELALTCKVVIAAGNESLNTNYSLLSRIRENNVYVVSSITRTDDIFSSFSNYGNSVTHAAPGSEILSTYLNGGYGVLSGTSMAAPHVTGMLLVGGMYISGKAQNDPDGRPDPIPSLNCVAVDADGDGHSSCVDPDDNDPTVFLGATELCDNKDNDGDGLVDEGDVCCPDGDVTRLYVSTTGNSTNLGTSWGNSLTLSAALNLAQKCSKINQIWVAAGTYIPSTNEFGIDNPTNPRTKTFILRRGLTIYGSFIGNEPDTYAPSNRQ